MPARDSATIAIVDDDASVCKALLRLLHTAGLHGQAVESGAEFLRSMQSCRYGCVILDLHMYDVTGFEVQSRCMLEKPPLRTIIITAHDEQNIRQRCLSVGATAYFCKPVDNDELLEAIKQALS